MDEMGVQRRLPVVDAALGHERDQIVGIEIDGVGVGCRHIVAQPPSHQPRTWAEKVLAGDGGKRLNEARIVDACGGKYLLGVAARTMRSSACASIILPSI